MTSLFVCCFCVILGCWHARYVEGHGDAEQFMLQRVFAYDGHFLITNGERSTAEPAS